MKKLAFVCCMLLFVYLVLSCSSAIPPKSFISNSFFNFNSPTSENWYIELANVDSTILHRGYMPVHFGTIDLPIQRLEIYRKNIQDTLRDETALIYALKGEANAYIEDMVKKSTPLGQFGYGHYYDSSNYVINYFHTIIYSITGLITDAKTLVQVYFYLPKYYKEWKKCYLLLYSEYPYYLSEEHRQAIIYRNPFDLELSPVLNEVLEKFKCIEDSTKN